MMKRIWALFQARNLEFLRDRSTLAWNLLLPFLLVFGLAVLFSGDGRPLFKAGVIAAGAVDAPLDQQLHPFLATRHVEFYRVPDSALGSAIQKVGRHQVDMLLDLRPGQMQYWVNEASTNGYFLQQLLQADNNPPLQASSVEGEQIRYVDWVVPGILGMNIMFSCLFGVGYVIVRYRKSGYYDRDTRSLFLGKIKAVLRAQKEEGKIIRPVRYLFLTHVVRFCSNLPFIIESYDMYKDYLFRLRSRVERPRGL